MAVIWPGHACDRGTLGKLIADGLLVAPFRSEPVDEDDVVRLRQGKLLGVG